MTAEKVKENNEDWLDLQYDLTQKDDVDAYELEFKRLSRQSEKKHRGASYNIQYGVGENQRLDVFPAAKANAPVHIFIHGGYWREGDMADWRFIADGIVENDVTLVLPTYEVSKGTQITTIFEQVINAVQWVYQNIENYGGNPHNITLTGHSAGGHLAAMLLTVDWLAFEIPKDVIKNTLLISGLFDMQAIDKCRFLREFYHINLSETEIKLLSPQLLIPQTKAPLFLYVGENETDEYLRNTKLLAACWSNEIAEITEQCLPEYDHFSIILQLNDPKSELSQLIKQMSMTVA